MKHIIEVELKQHTPIVVPTSEKLYFLRPTELRPKLNRFLTYKFRQEHSEEAPPNEWIYKKNKDDVKSSQFAFRFSIKGLSYRYEGDNLEQGERSLNWKDSVALLANKYSNKKFLQFTIQTPNQDLSEFIKKHLEDFFIVENFGGTSSKGFGQFTLIEKDDSSVDYEKKLKQYFNPYTENSFLELKLSPYQKINSDQWTIYKYSYPFEDGSFNNLQRQVLNKLKAGVNFKNRSGEQKYQKSLLWLYFKCKYPESFKSWTKYAIKKHLIPLLKDENKYLFVEREDGKPKFPILENKDYFNRGNNIDSGIQFIRALLGLPELYQFKLSGNNGLANVKVKSTENQIEQFSNPIQVKIFNQSIYFIPMPIPTELLGAKFEFYKESTEDGNKLFEVNVPNDFNLIDFLDFEFKIIMDPNSPKMYCKNTSEGKLTSVCRELRLQKL